MGLGFSGGVTQPLKLICLKAAAPQFDAAKGVDGLPNRILVMPWGESQTTEGRFNGAAVHERRKESPSRPRCHGLCLLMMREVS